VRQLKIFVSYSWSDSWVRSSLVERLERIGNVKPIYDRESVRPDSISVHEKILDDLIQSDVVLAVLTDQSLKSVEVREELSLAYEWHVPFMFVRDTNVSEKLPWFLKDPSFIQFDLQDRNQNPTDFLNSVEKEIERLKSDYPADQEESHKTVLKSLYSKLRQMSKSISLHDPKTKLFRLKMMEDVLEVTATEIKNLISEDYKQDLSLEKSFIVRAGPIFGSATRAYAASVDRVSKFWISEEQRTNAQEYTQKQAKSTKRLFVFSNPKNAQYYRQVLAAHHERYGREKEGGVFICAFEQYEKLMHEIVGDKYYKSQFLDRDFGVLVFGEGEEEEMYRATLSDTRLALESIKGQNDKKSAASVRRVFDSFSDPNGDFAKKFVIHKWQEFYKDNNEPWKNALREIFQIDTNGKSSSSAGFGDVYHLVFFSDDAQDSDLIHEISREILRLDGLITNDGRKLIKDIVFGAKTNFENLRLPLLDGRYNGELLMENFIFDKLPYWLLMKFENIDDWLVYMNDYTHSEIRENIYKTFDAENNIIKDLYQLLKTTTKEDPSRKLLYRAIEVAASKYMFRAHYSEHFDLDLIVNMLDPKPFKLPSEG
jgi:TIR domain